MITLFWIYGGLTAILVLAALVEAWRGVRLLEDLSGPRWDRGPGPSLTVVVPARNEAQGIGACLSSLAAQEYPGLEIIAVDDRSTDQTGEIMDAIAQKRSLVHVVHVSELPPGWLGKTHAMSLGASLAKGEWLLFTDGDVEFRTDCLRRAVAYADEVGTDHLTVLPTLILRSVGEHMMIGVMQMGLLALRPSKIEDRSSRHAFGAGAFNMVRRSVYGQIGGFGALRMQIVEDIQLAQRIKGGGFRSRVALGPSLASVHWASGALGIVRNGTKNIYAALEFRSYLALAMVLGLFAFFVAPFPLMALAPGWTKVAFGVAIGGIVALYVVFRPLGGVSPWYALIHPVGSLFLAYAIARSVALTTLRGGVEWRGTKYGIDELRQAVRRQGPVL